jgi:hypothetical protein
LSPFGARSIQSHHGPGNSNASETDNLLVLK